MRISWLPGRWRPRGLAAVVMLPAVLMCVGGGSQPEGSATPPAEVVVSLGQPFELGLSMTVTVSETGTRLTFIDVAEDSRCRAQVNCIWAGRVVVEVKADTPGVGTEMLTLATCCAQAEARDVLAGQSIELRGVSPDPPPPGQAIPSSDYRAELVVTRS